MKKLITIMFAIFLFTSCKEKTNEDFVKESFLNYVQTDFDDPNSFEEITSIQAVDTVDKKFALETIKSIEDISVLLSDAEVEKAAEYKRKFEEDNTCIISYEVKVRIKRNGRKSLITYYVIDDGVNYKVQDHEMRIDEVPKLYKDFYEFAYKLVY